MQADAAPPQAPLLAPVAPAPWPVRLLGRLVDWVTEFGELLMVWVTFLGGACAAQRGSHMTITEFIDKLDTAQRRWADAAVQLLCLAMLLVLVRYGWNLVDVNWGNRLTVLQWPMAVQYMGMAVGCTLMAAFVAWDLWQILRGVPRARRYAPDH